MKKISAFVVLLALIVGLCPNALAAGGMSAFSPVRDYRSGQFSDVSDDAWYAENVRLVYEYGLMNGAGSDTFAPDSPITVTQVIAVAARISRIYETGRDDFLQGRLWYDVYVRYALDRGIISTRFNCRRTATRAEAADILSRSLPESALRQMNSVADGAISGVSSKSEYAGGIYRLYRAGVLSGSDGRGTFSPDEPITRAEAAAIIARIIVPSMRKSFTLDYSGPDVPEARMADDEFFSDAAMLGNSLVDGLRLYGGLKEMDFYCATSVTVVSALKTADVETASGGKVTLLNKLLSKQYGKIYIELGINEIGFDTQTFIDLYGDMADRITAAQPDADVYFISLLPVTKKRSDSSSTFNMTRINKYNDALRELAAEKHCYYLDVCSAFLDDEGYLSEDWDVDGVHLLPNYYSIWEDYVRTHYVK